MSSATPEAGGQTVPAAAKPRSETVSPLGPSLFGSGRPRWKERLVEWLLLFVRPVHEWNVYID